MATVDESSGIAPYGNFKRYYDFNSAEKRLKLLPVNILELFRHTKEISVLDIGCNAGNLTVGIYNHFVHGHNHNGPNVHILAVDIDPHLILRAQQSNPYPNNIEYAVLDIMDETVVREVLARNLETFKKVKFDLMLCFSVTMWIHLNHGDEGLQKFLKFASTLAQYLLLEPQHWKCYMSASRRMRRLNCNRFQDFSKLSVTRTVTENIDSYLEEYEMKKLCEFGVTDWKRNVLLYKHIGTSEVHITWQWI